MKRYITLIFAILLFCSMTACDTQKPQTSGTSTIPSTATEPYNKPLSNHFNSDTNETFLFGQYQFDIPNNWICSEDDKMNAVWFSPNSEPPISALFLIDSEEKYDLTMETYQKALAEKIINIYRDAFIDASCNIKDYYVPRKYFTLASGEKVDVTGRKELHIECNGIMDGKNYEGKVIAFYIGNELVSFYLFQFYDAPYNYLEDMAAITATIKVADKDHINNTEEGSYGNLTDSDATTSDIKVRFVTDHIDGDRLHIKVFTKNNSDATFSGNVYVTFYSADGKDRLGSDTIIVDELLPGRESWADIIVDAYRGTPKMTVDFSEVSFASMKNVIAEVDSDATKETKSSYYWNFDGVSWYKDITDIVAYKNGTCVVVLKDNPKEAGQFYASTIWSCGNDHGVDTVQVVDAKGTIIAVYGNGEMVSVLVSNGVIIAESNTSTEVQGTETTESQTTPSSHSWNNGETTKKATCSETGVKTYTCLKCSEQKIESIPKTDHNYDDGKVSKNPTCTLEGVKEYRCATCGATKTELIPLVAHSYSKKIISDKYLLADATYTSGSVYYYSCICGAIGNKTFTTDDRIEWVSVSQLEHSGFNCSFALPLPDDDPQYYWLKNYNTGTVYKIYGVPSETLVNGKIYTCNCNGYSIRIKSEKTESYSNYRDYFFFYYDDLVSAGII